MVLPVRIIGRVSRLGRMFSGEMLFRVDFQKLPDYLWRAGVSQLRGIRLQLEIGFQVRPDGFAASRGRAHRILTG
jgi:hypothetical protein